LWRRRLHFGLDVFNVFNVFNILIANRREQRCHTRHHDGPRSRHA
jgi:hypothetical protein